jgi:hypothetical protein
LHLPRIGERKDIKTGGVAVVPKKKYSGLMASTDKLNFKKLFWVTTAVLSILVLLYPVEDREGWILKFLVILITPLLAGSLGLALGALDLIFSPILKHLKMWFLR